VAAIRRALAAFRAAMANDGIRRLEVGWMLGVAADAALFVALLVVAFQRDGVVGTGLLGAFRMAPAIVSGAASGAALRRWSGRRVLVVVAVLRTIVAVLTLVAIAADIPIVPLYLLAALGGGIGAIVRPVQATLMPAVARTPEELVAANVAWGTVEGIGSLVGPAIAAALIAIGAIDLVAGVAAIAFALTLLVMAGLRFEQASDALAGSASAAGVQLVEGLRVLRRRPIAGWSMLGVFGQTLTRGLLNAVVVVAAVELLGLGDPGVGTLNAAMGIGGLVGGVFAMSLVRPSTLLSAQAVTLAFWGLPIAVIGLLPIPVVGIAAMAAIGTANAGFDAAVFTIFQRACSNPERGPVFAIFEATAGLGVVAGSLLGPVLLEAFGPRGGMVVCGAVLPILAVVLFIRIGRLPEVSTIDERVVALLRRIPAFEALPLTGIERLAGAAGSERHAAGSILMRQGDPGDRFVIVERGEVEVRVDDRAVQQLGPGAGIGEVALLRATPRTATVTALTDVTLVTVAPQDFCAAVSGPTALSLMERVVRERLGHARSSA
jgi:Cyclic nucleotide-binding domain/Major Facilitator Superfamily